MTNLRKLIGYELDRNTNLTSSNINDIIMGVYLHQVDTAGAIITRENYGFKIKGIKYANSIWLTVYYQLLTKSFINIDTHNIRKSYIEEIDGAVIAKGIRYYAVNPIWLKMIVNKNGKVAVEIDNEFS